MNNNKSNQNKNNNYLFDLSSIPTKDLLNNLNTSELGMTEQNIKISREKNGTNKITQHKEKGLIRHLIDAFINPFTMILIFLAGISLVTDVILPLQQNEDTDIMTIVIIISMIMISGLLRFFQESRSNNAAEKLLNLITTTATVRRIENGVEEIELEDIVVGDIIQLSAGDMIPADVRILQAKDLFITQASLTGESEPQEKHATTATEPLDGLFDYENLAFLGSNVISGFGIAVVIAVGDKTQFGLVNKQIAQEPVPTNFEKGVNSVSWLLIRFMLVMVPVVFFINGFTKGDWINTFLFAVSVAVGLTPEMLPMIVTTCLAKGAISMSKEKTIVKNLNSIQNFGAIDILCTDKTGTLTQDKVVLLYHLNPHGQEDNQVLKYAFLNSHFQTGLKNLMDVAIIEGTKEASEKEPSLHQLDTLYKKLDEVPFDFKRRRMSVVVENNEGSVTLITKGAVEEMLSISKYVKINGNIETITEENKKQILKTVNDLNEDGMRVIAVAYKNNPSPVGAFGVQDENEMTLIGYLAFLDPPKESVTAAIKSLLEYGVVTKILTGDNEKVTRCVCKQVGLDVKQLLLGSDIEKMNETELAKAVEQTNVFAKLAPDQKSRVIEVLRENGHVVGFMGDGINDAPAMKKADIGISVDTAVDIAKESADIILLEKDLMVLEKGLIEGRKTYANMIKYIKMTASSNFGNVFSVVVASAFLPFLPMLSIHLILLNLIYDLSCTAVPWDNVDKEFLLRPKKWDASSVGKFMLWIGPTSSVFDMTTYALMYFIICPTFVSDGLLFTQITEGSTILSGPFAGMDMQTVYIAMFQAGWFVESMWSQSLVIHMIRTPKIPFIQSRASALLTFFTSMGCIIATWIPFTDMGLEIGFVELPDIYFAYLALTILLYMILVTIMKKIYIHRYGELL